MVDIRKGVQLATISLTSLLTAVGCANIDKKTEILMKEAGMYSSLNPEVRGYKNLLASNGKTYERYTIFPDKVELIVHNKKGRVACIDEGKNDTIDEVVIDNKVCLRENGPDELFAEADKYLKNFVKIYTEDIRSLEDSKPLFIIY